MSETPAENLPPPEPMPPATPQASASPAPPRSVPPAGAPKDAPSAPFTPKLKKTAAKLGQTLRLAKNPPQGPPKERRDFFGEAVREMLGPFAGMIERKINPFIQALEQFPDDVERLANNNFGLLDQMATSPPQPRLAGAPDHRGEPERCLRPPGAIAPGADPGFESVCSRCAKCVEACPADAIQLDPRGLTAEGFPYIVAENQPCVVCESLACMKSCPTGALQLVDRLAIHMGAAAVDHHACLRDHGENCTLCIDVCPIDGNGNPSLSALFISPESGRVRVRKNICIGCGLCENRCPTEPRAITVLPYAPAIDPIIA